MSKITEIVKKYMAAGIELYNEDMRMDEFVPALMDLHQRAEAEILASLWASVEDGLPGGDESMDWIVRRPLVGIGVFENLTGGEMSAMLHMASYEKGTEYMPIPPTA